MPTIIKGMSDGFVKNLVMVKKPNKIRYKIGENLDFTGIKLAIKFNNKLKEVTMDKITFVPPQNELIKDDTTDIITVAYKEFSNSEPIEIPLLIL